MQSSLRAAPHPKERVLEAISLIKAQGRPSGIAIGRLGASISYAESASSDFVAVGFRWSALADQLAQPPLDPRIGGIEGRCHRLGTSRHAFETHELERAD